MSEIKVTQMPEASNINDNDLFMIIQGGYNKKIPKELLRIPTKAHQVNVGEDEEYKVNLLKTKNLIDLDNMKILGGYNDSGYVSSPNYLTLQFIKVKPSTTYTLTTNLDLSKYIALRIIDFNSNQTFIRRSSGIAYTTNTYTFTTSNDAYYIALAFYTDGTASLTDITQAQFEEGSTSTEYTPFIPNQINVDNEKYSDTINVGATEDSRSRVNVLYSKNLLNYNSSVNGVIAENSTSESLSSDVSAITSAWIPCKPNTTYIISGGANRNRWQTKASNGTITYAGSTASITTNSTAAYMRVYYYYGSSSTSPTSITNVMINEGTTALPFEPYVVPSIKVDNEEIYNKALSDYSTNEQRIGTWIDGKPLYRKVATGDITSSGVSGTWSYSYIGSFPNVDTILIKSAIFILTDLNNRKIMPPYFFANGTDRIIISGIGTAIEVSNNSTHYGRAIIVAEYTKTTD